MNAPVLDTDGDGQTTTDGRKWALAFIQPGTNKLLAGRTIAGDFYCYTDVETLFDTAMTMLLQEKGIEL